MTSPAETSNPFPLCFVDIEATTGTTEERRIVEICVCKLNVDGTVEGPFTRRMDPRRPMGYSENIHGISNADVHGLKPFAMRAHDLAKFVRGSMLVAHNAKSCDAPTLRAEFERAGVLWPFHHYVVDTMPLCKRLWPGADSLKLKDIVRSLVGSQADLVQEHTAEGDVALLMMLWTKIRPCIGWNFGNEIYFK